jgi:predicted GIY-YIG superfamily endonuclease
MMTALRVALSATTYAKEIAAVTGYPTWPLYTHWDVEQFSDFPEFIDDPNDRSRWAQLNVLGHWFVYAAFAGYHRPPKPIYIGMTNNLERRLLQHQRSRWWWGEVDRLIISIASSKREALDHEKRYIQVTSPCYNTQHYKGE